jgi:hypothetical protein
MVTSENFDELRPLNFGFEALSEPLSADSLTRQIARYDPVDVARVRDRIRACAGLEDAVGQLVRIYRQAIEGNALAQKVSSVGSPDQRSIRDRLFLRAYWAWRTLPPSGRNMFERLGASTSVRARAREILGMGALS